MNDLRICNKLAEIESISYWNHLGKCVLKAPWSWGEESPEYNPLTDDALCFQLMVKYNVNLNIQDTSRKNVFHKYIACVDDFGVGLDKTSPNKAICLAIIEANKGK